MFPLGVLISGKKFQTWKIGLEIFVLKKTSSIRDTWRSSVLEWLSGVESIRTYAPCVYRAYVVNSGFNNWLEKFASVLAQASVTSVVLFG